MAELVFIQYSQIIFINIQHPDMTEQEIEIFSFGVTIQSVKMKVKFPCKMIIELRGTTLTNEVSSNDSNKFIFNQEANLKGDHLRPFFELTITITTDKGARYIAGVIKLQQSELINQEGELLIIPLSKCLDPEATCEIRVQEVTSEKVMRKMQLDKSIPGKHSPNQSPDIGGYGGAKSEFHFPSGNFRQKREWEEHKSREEGFVGARINRTPTNYFKKQNFAATQIERSTHEFQIDPSNRDKLIEAEVYKEGYQKLKEKYKREAETAKQELNKRMALENNQNNFKLEIMRLKLKSEEQERSANDKTVKLKELQNQVASLQKKELDLEYLKEENANKDHMIRMLEETIRTLNRDNDDLKTLNRERFEAEQTKIKELRNEIESLKLKYESKELEWERQVKMKLEVIAQREMEIRSKNEQIEREKRLVDDLERAAENRIYEFERTMQNEKNAWKTKVEELKGKIERLERQKADLEEEIRALQAQGQKSRTLIVKLEYDKKILLEESDTFKSEIKELKAIKDKHQELSREHKLLNEDKLHLQKQLDRAISTKETNIAELTKQHQEQLEYYKKIFREADDKLKQSQSRNVELESQLEQRKNEIEKLKRMYDALHKENNDLKEKQRNNLKLLKAREEEVSTAQLELNALHHKLKGGDEIYRIEIEKNREEITRLKLELEGEFIKSTQLGENNNSLSIELNRVKLQLQYTEEKMEKDSQTLKEKIDRLESQLADGEQKVEELNSLIENSRSSEKEGLSKIQKLEIQALKAVEKIERLQKEVKLLEEKVSYSDGISRNKKGEIESLHNNKLSLEKKIQELEEKLSGAKNEVNTLMGEKNKNEKIIALLQKDLDESRKQTERWQERVGEQEKLEDELRAEIKKGKEENLKLEMKANGLRKEFDKFKEAVLETATSTYSQIPSPDLKSSSVSVEFSRKKDNESWSGNDILNRIAAQNKQLKLTMSKMIEQNRLLQAENEKLSGDIVAGTNKFQAEEFELQRQIQQLEDEISKCYEEREETKIRTSAEINELNIKIQEGDSVNKELLIQVEELNFTINSLRLDQESNNEHFNLKYSQYRSKIAELEEKVEYLSKELEKEEIKSHDIDERLNSMTINYEKEKEIRVKRERQIEVLIQEKSDLTALVEELKKHKKELNEKVTETEFKFNAEVEVNQKIKALLEDEEHKATELKNFISELMKQKEQAIKSQLEKSELIITLEGQIAELTREKEILTEECERNKRHIEEQKENHKKLGFSFKELQALLTDERQKQLKTSQKLREKEKELNLKEEEYQNLQFSTQEQIDRLHKEAAEVQSELEDQKYLHAKVTNELNDRLAEFEKSESESTRLLEKYKSEVLILEENLFGEKRNNEVKGGSIDALEEEILELRSKVDNYQISLNGLNEEVREKEESMFQLSGKIYNLEIKLETRETEMNEKLDSANEDWNCKYDGMCEEYEQRMELIEKEKDYFKARLEEKEEELRKCLSSIKDSEMEDSNLKKVLEEKVRRLEDQRLSLITAKNNEIQKISEENKGYFDSVKTKEADIRRLHHELEIARSTIGKLDFHKKETEEKVKNISKIYQAELEQLKRKEAAHRSMKEAISKCEWNLEREVKRLIQGFMKKVIQGMEQEETSRVIENIKGLEQNVMAIIHSKIEEVK